MRLLARPRLVMAWLLAGGFLVCAALSLPGHLSYDSVMQLNEGRRGFYANWHPPMMSWILGVCDWLLPGTALFVLFDIALFFGSFWAVLRLERTPSRAAVVVLALILLTPQVLSYQGIVWKDVLFADLALAGFAALAIGFARWDNFRLRIALLIMAFLLLCVAALVRQNGAVTLPAAIAAVAWLAWCRSVHRLRASLLYGLGGALGASLALVVMHGALALRIPGDPSPMVNFRLLQFYDLIGAVKADPQLKLPYLDDDDTGLEALMRSDGVKLYTPERNDTLAQSDRLQTAYFASPDETIPEEWHHLIAAHPGLYLAVRAEVFRWVFFTPDLPRCRPVFTGIDGPAEEMKKLGLAKRFDWRDAALGFYARQFMGTPVFSHPAFFLVGLIIFIALMLRRRGSDIAIAALLLSAFIFTASFFVISIACDYRYLYFLDVATLLALFHLALDWRSAWKIVKAHLG